VQLSHNRGAFADRSADAFHLTDPDRISPAAKTPAALVPAASDFVQPG
jgi:hypothetical protein